MSGCQETGFRMSLDRYHVILGIVAHNWSSILRVGKTLHVLLLLLEKLNKAAIVPLLERIICC